MKLCIFFRKKHIILAFIISFLILSCGIYYFSSIGQPQTAQPGDLLDIPITVRVDSTDGWGAWFTVSLPEGWTIPADSVEYSGDYDGAIYFDGPSNWMDGRAMSPNGYQWWVGYGNGPFEADSGDLSFNLPVKTDSISGIYYLSYMLGYSGSHGAFGIKDFVKDKFITLLDAQLTPPLGGAAFKTVTLDAAYSFKFQDFPFFDADGNQMIGIRITDIKKGFGLTYDNASIVENKDYLDVSKFLFTPHQASRISQYVAFDFQVIDNSYDYSDESYQMTLNIIDGHRNFYVSADGYDGNPGTAGQPFRSISQALSVIKSDSLDPRNIFISNGIYSPQTTGEEFPLQVSNFVSLSGDSEDGVIIDAAGSGTVIILNNTSSNINNLTLTGGDRLYQSEGSGIICYSSSIQMENITISANKANEGAGLKCLGNSKLSLINVSIYDNHANWAGGGIFSYDSTIIELSNVNIYNNTANRAGGIYMQRENENKLIMNNVNIIRNYAQSVGGIEAYNFSMFDGMICDNFSNWDASAVCGNNFSLINVTIANNSTGLDNGCILMEPSWEYPGSFVNLVNTIVWGNSPPKIMMVYSEFSESFLNVVHSDIQGGRESIIIENKGYNNWFDNNIDMNPMFAGVSDGNYNLLPASPCIDKGIQDTIFTYNNDLDTLAVPVMTYSGAAPDMGAIDAHIGIPYFEIGPVILKGYRSFEKVDEGYPVKITLQNIDTINKVENIAADIWTEDNCIGWIEDSWLEFGDIAPREEKECENYCYFYLNEECAQSQELQIAIKVEIRWNNIQMWQDSSRIDDSTFVHIIVDLKDEKEPVPTKFKLSQNYPNPFNTNTMISYQLAITSKVELSIYNILGQKMATLVNKKQVAGNYQVLWDATGFASGVYLYRLTTNNGFVRTRKLLVLK